MLGDRFNHTGGGRRFRLFFLRLVRGPGKERQADERHDSASPKPPPGNEPRCPYLLVDNDFAVELDNGAELVGYRFQSSDIRL